MNSQVQTYSPVVTLGRAEVARVSYIGLCAWALQGIAQARAITVPFTSHPIEVQEAISDTVSIMASRALASALGRLEPRETCGRVVLVAVEEQHVQRDPIIPLALLDLGREYNKAFGKYVQHLVQYQAAIFRGSPQKWWNRACGLCNKTIDALEKAAHVLTIEELSYLVVKLQVPLAWPQGQETTDNW